MNIKSWIWLGWNVVELKLLEDMRGQEMQQDNAVFFCVWETFLVLGDAHLSTQLLLLCLQ